MNLKEQICRALCAGFEVHAVPMGFAIKAPFPWFTGDALTFYGRVDGDLVRFEDDGLTISELEGAGVDLSNDTRLEILYSLTSEHSIIYDDVDIIFCTEWVRACDAGYTAASFLSFMNRVQDLLFTAKPRITGTFRDDLVAEIKRRLGGDAVVLTDEAPVQSMSEYIADIVVKHKNGRVAAIFPGISEQKALEAILFSKELELNKVGNVIPFLIYENSNSSRVTRRTQTRALNSDLELAAWDGGHQEAVEKVAKFVAQAR
ncbi:DUF1828 domain-containing protein [Azospirillum himalayense]|uniref:DUF1828 domain-containing protein n=1 Tax=Azospirillum himalayense TaxID=654847 RepID=A0ABW0GBU3_9PROT